jgi:hypothetical protein
MEIQLPVELPLGRVAGDTYVLCLGTSHPRWRPRFIKERLFIPPELLVAASLVPVIALLFLRPRRRKVGGEA